MPLSILALPPEVRVMIYDHYFASITITFGKPSPTLDVHNPLSLTQSCRVVHGEVMPMIPGSALLDFIGIGRFLNFMMSSPLVFIQRIRRISLSAEELQSRRHKAQSRDCQPWVSRMKYIHDTLHILKGLRLDCLMLRYNDSNQNDTSSAYELEKKWELERLLKIGCGWKELVYFAPSLSVIEPKFSDPFHAVTDRPASWDNIIKARDGNNSAMVTVYLVQAKRHGDSHAFQYKNFSRALSRTDGMT